MISNYTVHKYYKYYLNATEQLDKLLLSKSKILNFPSNILKFIFKYSHIINILYFLAATDFMLRGYNGDHKTQNII